MGNRASSIGSPVSRTSSTATLQASQRPETTFMRAVVVELLNDPSYYTDEELIEIFNNLSNPKILTGNPQIPPFSEDDGDKAEKLRYLIPRNSLLVNIVNAGAAKSESKLTLCFPFFPPYMQFPVKPGEQIWVMSERPSQEMTYLYWVCRITAPGFTDDVNYTHLDRQILPTPAEDPQFPNGDGTAAHYTMPDEDSFDTIVDDSSSGLSFTAEPVPRLTKRPGDLVLQGSNNTLILMSDDRGWGSDENPADSETSNASKTEEEISRVLAGSVDVVAGRGRFLGDPDSDPELTAPRVVANTRDNDETDKYFTNPVEGDPDFVNDSSRVYVSMNSNGDEKLGLVEGDTIPTPLEGSYDAHNDEPYVIMKSDNIRIVARKNEDKDINGSIRIVKEGATDEDLATIMITPEGNVQISGAKIFIGRAGDDGGTGAVDGAEPYMRFSDFKTYMDATLDAVAADIKSLADAVSELKNTVTPGYGGPDPACIAASSLASAWASTNIDGQKDTAMDDIMSKRIFGE